jgi:hypothetical protein
MERPERGLAYDTKEKRMLSKPKIGSLFHHTIFKV